MGTFSLLPVRAWAWIGLAGAVAFFAWQWDSAAFDRGVAACEGRHAKELAASAAVAEAKAREIVVQDTKTFQQGTATRERIRVVYRVREAELAGSPPVDCGACRLSDAGIGLLNDALANTAEPPPTYPGKQPDQVPRPTVPDTNREDAGGGRNIGDRDRKVL
jgi:hypothetical protein